MAFLVVGCLVTTYYDRTAAEYAARWGDLRLERALRSFVRRLSGPRRVLDLGCGPGRDLDYLGAMGCRVIGLDLSTGMLAQARRRLPTAPLLCADLRRLPLADACLDGVWASASLLHLPRAEMPAALGGIARCLRPAGVLYLSLKSGQGEAWVGDDELRLLFTYYQPAQVESLLLHAGFHLAAHWIEPDRAGRPWSWLNFLARKV